MVTMSMHPPLPFLFGILGNVISFLVFLAPMPTFIRIYKKKSTEGFQSVPYLVALFSSMLWLYYAMLKRGDALLLITVNSFGCFIETLYISLYIAFAPKENRDWTIKVLAAMNMGLFSFILLITQFLVNGMIRVQVLGWICVAISVSVFAAPLSIVAQVIRTKSVEFMPINLSIALTLSAVAWLTYGLFSKDICVALPNVLGLILGLLQMLLYALFRNSKQVPEQKVQQEDNLKTIVVVNTSGNSEEIKEPEKDKNPQIELPCKNIEQNLESLCALKTVEVVVA